MTNDSTSILDEFKDINFKDKRLNNRFNAIMQNLERTPSGLISKAFIDAKDQKAAYRFLENEKTEYEVMLSSHQKRVQDRCRGHKIILAIQDSTTLLLKGARNASGVGRIGDLTREFAGLNIHTSLLISPEQEILGISDLRVFERYLIGKRSKTREQLSALKKETGRWLRAITNTRNQIGSKSKLVWIADREGDFWDYFSILDESKEWFVQRVVHQREIQDSKEDYFTYLKKQPIVGNYTFEISGKGGPNAREKRVVECDIRTVEVTLKKPKRLTREMKTLHVRAIYIVEKGNDNPLEWFLITNIECNSFEDILEKIKWYQLRWTIEELHKVVKSGCGVEEMRLEDSNRLIKYLLLLFIVGARILWMTKLARQSEEIKCTEAFSDDEWRVLYIRKYKKKPAEGFIPSMKEAVRLLAILGGFYEYNKRDPGTMTIWRGMSRLKQLLDGIGSITMLKELL